jgi:hypothetical protein
MPVHQRSKAQQKHRNELQHQATKKMGYLLLATLTTLEMIISPIAIFLSRHLEASSSALSKPPSSGESNTFARAHGSSRTAKHTVSQRARWHSSKASSSQFSRKGRDLRSQTCCCARRRAAHKVSLIERERCDGCWSWNGPEARCPSGA